HQRAGAVDMGACEPVSSAVAPPPTDPARVKRCLVPLQRLAPVRRRRAHARRARAPLADLRARALGPALGIAAVAARADFGAAGPAGRSLLQPGPRCLDAARPRNRRKWCWKLLATHRG